MDSSTDIIVVGCGAAGAAAAETAASHGSRVLVLEEHDRAGVPSHCSGHVGIKGMKRLGVQLSEKIVKNQIRGAIFHSPSGRVIRLERQAPVTWVLDRREFDEHLAARAKAAGAEILFGRRALSVRTSESSVVEVRVDGKGNSDNISSSVVIDCEGAAPAIAPCRPANERRKSMWVNSAQVQVENVKDGDQDLVEVYLGSKYAPGFFAWIIPWRDGTAKVGLASREGNARILLERFIRKHPDASRRLKGTSVRDASFHPIPLGGPISKTYYPHLLVAGDSAQQVKPTTGGGILFSIICGKVAGRVAHEASTAGDASESFLSKYETQWKKEIGRDLDMMRRIRRLLFRLPDRNLEKIFSVARSFGVGNVLSKADDIDMQGRVLARLGLDPRLAISLLYSTVLSLPFLADSIDVEKSVARYGATTS